MEKSCRRSRAAGMQWVALFTLGAATLVAAACSDDPAAPGPSASGGEGGEPEAAGGGGASPGAAGSAQQAGADMGEGGLMGEGGVAGMPPLLTAGEECATCGDVECKAELEACTANPECAPWLSCVTACDDEACIEACDATHAHASRIYYGVYDCLCSQCQDACAASNACDKQCVDEALPNDANAPATLAETGLYAGYQLGESGAGGAGGAPSLEPGTELLTLAPYVQLFEPKYPLWSDGAEKERHIYIPKCSTIDNSDPDHWEFPVGTRLWKRFTVPGNGEAGTRVETRFMHHYGPGEADWTFAAYQWDVDAPDDPAAAGLVDTAGALSVNGTTHDIPGVDQCQNCHTRVSERVLGFGSIQLSHDTNGADLTIAKASHLGWLTDPAPEGFAVPGTPAQQAALGYLHGNCGNCHNPSQLLGAGAPNDNTPLVLSLAVGQTVYEQTDTVTSSVGVIVASGLAAITGKPRIDPMVPSNSALLLRMEARGVPLQMPPVVTNSSKVADQDGVSAITTWIDSIPP